MIRPATAMLPPKKSLRTERTCTSLEAAAVEQRAEHVGAVLAGEDRDLPVLAAVAAAGDELSAMSLVRGAR